MQRLMRSSLIELNIRYLGISLITILETLEKSLKVAQELLIDKEYSSSWAKGR